MDESWVVSFEELQELAGCKQQSKVANFLKASKIPHVIGADGKPRTTRSLLDKWAEGDSNGKKTSSVRFKFKPWV